MIISEPFSTTYMVDVTMCHDELRNSPVFPTGFFNCGNDLIIYPFIRSDSVYNYKS